MSRYVHYYLHAHRLLTRASFLLLKRETVAVLFRLSHECKPADRLGHVDTSIGRKECNMGNCNKSEQEYLWGRRADIYRGDDNSFPKSSKVEAATG